MTEVSENKPKQAQSRSLRVGLFAGYVVSREQEYYGNEIDDTVQRFHFPFRYYLVYLNQKESNHAWLWMWCLQEEIYSIKSLNGP
jgi:hypothetical protein